MLRSDQNNEFSCTDVSPLSATQLCGFSMCAVNAKFVYITGGRSDQVVANCHRYDIERNLWQEMQ